MPVFEGCCSYSSVERKKSFAYVPSRDKSEIKQEQQQEQLQQQQQQQQQQQLLQQQKQQQQQLLQQQQQQRQRQQKKNFQLTPLLTSEFQGKKPSICKGKSNCSSCDSDVRRKDSTVQFNVGSSTESTEIVCATKRNQNDADEDVENCWSEDQKSIAETATTTTTPTFGTDDVSELNAAKLSVQSAIEMSKSMTDDNSSSFLEKTCSESKLDGNFDIHLQRCHEMENVHKVEFE